MDTPKDNELRQRIGLVSLLVILWLLLACLEVFWAWPIHPNSSSGWLLLLIVAPPLVLGFRAFFALMLSKPSEKKKTRKLLYYIRITLGIIVYFFMIGILLWLKHTWGG
ncbi:MAG TPA: hypothetical protein VJ983_10595 [candidate division Zixibacteria bacterium]|nr:hypothetical protein [candidate division Zixibacteria bacterium]